MKSKIVISLSFVTIILATFIFAQSSEQKYEQQVSCGEERNGLVLCAETKKKIYKIGDSISIHVFLKNNSKKTVEILRSNKEYTYNLKNEEGKLIDFSSSFKNNPLRAFVTRRGVEVAPKETISKEVILNEYFDLQSKGNYSFVAERLITSENLKDKIKIASGTIKITIQDKQTKHNSNL